MPEQIVDFYPENHDGVLYFFARNHEKLGFEKIIRVIQGFSPDIEAIRGGKQVNIELEYDSARVMEHYRVLYKSEQNEFENDQRGKWIQNGNYWHYLDNQTGKSLITKEDKGFWFDESRGMLLYKTLKTVGIDIVVFWIKNEEFSFWEFDKEVELIDLSKIRKDEKATTEQITELIVQV